MQMSTVMYETSARFARKNDGRAVAAEEVLEEGLHRRHREGRARAVALNVSEHVEVATRAVSDRLDEVAAHDVRRTPVGRVEPAGRLYRADRQKAPLDVRRELERLAVLVHLVLDEHLDAVRRDHLADSLEEHVRRNRLRQIVADRVVEYLLEEPSALLGVEGRKEEYRHGGVEAADYVAEHESIHVAHHDVRDDGAERVGVPLELRHRRLHSVDCDGIVAHLLQLRAESEPYQLLVVDDQYLRLAVRVGSHSSLLLRSVTSPNLLYIIA